MANIDHDNQFLNYILTGRGKSLYLEFLLTVNIALSGAYFILNNGSLFYLRTASGLFALILMVIINYSIMRIYLREHNLDKRIEVLFKSLFIEKDMSEPLKIRREILKQLELNDLEKTWKYTKLILALLLAFPCALIVSNSINCLPIFGHQESKATAATCFFNLIKQHPYLCHGTTYLMSLGLIWFAIFEWLSVKSEDPNKLEEDLWQLYKSKLEEK